MKASQSSLPIELSMKEKSQSLIHSALFLPHTRNMLAPLITGGHCLRASFTQLHHISPEATLFCNMFSILSRVAGFVSNFIDAGFKFIIWVIDFIDLLFKPRVSTVLMETAVFLLCLLKDVVFLLFWILEYFLIALIAWKISSFIFHFVYLELNAQISEMKAEYAVSQKFLVKLKSHDLAVEIATDGFLRYGEEIEKSRQYRLDNNKEIARCASEHDAIVSAAIAEHESKLLKPFKDALDSELNEKYARKLESGTSQETWRNKKRAEITARAEHKIAKFKAQELPKALDKFRLSRELSDREDVRLCAEKYNSAKKLNAQEDLAFRNAEFLSPYRNAYFEAKEKSDLMRKRIIAEETARIARNEKRVPFGRLARRIVRSLAGESKTFADQDDPIFVHTMRLFTNQWSDFWSKDEGEQAIT